MQGFRRCCVFFTQLKVGTFCQLDLFLDAAVPGGGVIEIAVAILFDHAAVIVVGAEGGAFNGPDAAAIAGGAQVIQVVAGIGAVFFILPVVNAQGTQILFLVGPVAEVGLAAVCQCHRTGVVIAIGKGGGF